MPFFIVLFFYITISIYQISAVTDALKLIFMVQSTFLEGVLFIISLFLTFTPFLGPILGIIGATFVWEWNILFSALLFFWPYLIGFLFFFFRNKSFEVALLGDMIAENAYKNNWNGIIILGCVRDVDVLKTIDMGIFALGSVPKKSEKKDRGSIDAPIEIDGLIINSNDWVYGDSTGVLVSKVELAIGVEPTTA